MHSNGKEYSTHVKGEDFEQLCNDYVVYDLELKCKNFNKNTYKDQENQLKHIREYLNQTKQLSLNEPDDLDER